MPDSTDLLEVARVLSIAGTSTDAALCRAASAVYYAVFHKILHAAARRFPGPDQVRLRD
ncbi:hypothetical protein [Acidisphaera sp. S103]|uniref:hypothetical protein n=1 Tax=Acidisphaera sp. S103 TaxID=1747223 RepID=UPI00131E2066|nr:hypothetical protein [Acidisphaera sp. S103]